jgi:class 3 adenylate cyclase
MDAGWSVITYDGRGCGDSDRDITDFSFESRIVDLECVIERAAPERFAVCGVVQGGPAAAAYAVRNPDRVAGLILSNTFVRGVDWYAVIPAMRVSRTMVAMAEDEWEFYTLNMASAITGYAGGDVAHRMADAYRSGMTPADYIKYRSEVDAIDLTDVFTQIAVPTLVVHDKQFTVERIGDIARGPAKLIPGARFIETADFVEAADTFLRDLHMEPGPRKVAPTSSHGMRDALRTILFTDIVGHTEMMQRLGDARGREVLREHERITREVLKAHGGTEVKTMGDGFLASFGSVTRAVECAVALQKAMREREGEALAVRCGLDAGEPIEDEGDLFGSTVILASRIAGQAAGGEIMASDVVRGLCTGKGFAFSDRGQQALKGFEEPVRVWEVGWQT